MTGCTDDRITGMRRLTLLLVSSLLFSSARAGILVALLLPARLNAVSLSPPWRASVLRSRTSHWHPASAGC